MNNYTQEKLISLFKNGKVSGERSLPHHIEMPVSNIFIFEKFVYKIYKNDNDYINKNFRNIYDKADRFNFTVEDFNWNHGLNKDIYIELKGIAVRDEKIEFVNNENAEELVIIMNKINTENTLPFLMVENKLSGEDYFNMGKQLAKALSKLPKVKTAKCIKKVMSERMKDVKGWVESEKKSISTKEKNKSFSIFDDKFNSYIKIVKNKELGVCCDNQMENIIYDNKKMYIMDSLHFKEAWMIADKSTNYYRLATDILVLAGKDKYKKFQSGFLSINPNYINRSTENFFIYYSSMIMWPYMYMLKTNDKRRIKIAEIYHNFMIKNYLK